KFVKQKLEQTSVKAKSEATLK
ncbi:hypothetical protein ACI3CN_002806, partial [Listeria monocytogenes]|nr:DUF817 domain-containing protein [Listeria monocytogenes]ECR2446765.1 DUF817 domain-containing protein [Listeria monocytogenes]EDO0845652.1 DUF817 domain-containing protein [Listeria monocytogenes]MCY81798.1 DUF817 domain-containing protein [Listeria monocytogenes]MCZ30535.1 DUF817 domain-containing protein [Listeria monocytogenes]